MHYKYGCPELFKNVEKPDFHNMNGKIVIYGAGLTGLLTAYLLNKQGIKARCFADSDEKKHGQFLYGMQIIPPEEIQQKDKDVFVIVSTNRMKPAWHYLSQELGIVNLFTPFSLFLEFDSEEFDKLPELPSEYHPESLDYNIDHFMLRCINLLTPYNMLALNVSVSEVCNLRCKHCNALMPCYDKPQYSKLDDVINDMDIILTGRNIHHINLEGGEPFLWKPLAKLIYYLNNRPEIYRYIVPITNGTIIPDEELLGALSLSKVRVKISDYEKFSRLDQLVDVLKKHGVRYWIHQQKWYAFVRFLCL